MVNKPTSERDRHLASRKTQLSQCLTIAQKFDWLTSANVVNFYIENQWNLLPKSWTNVMNNIEPGQLFYLFTSSTDDDDEHIKPKNNIVWPLSLLCLRMIIQKIISDRKPTLSPSSSLPYNSDEELLHQQKIEYFLNKRVKSKKRHEVTRLSTEIVKIASQTGVRNIVDLGAGLGHLSRFIATGGGLRVCCLEQNVQLSQNARELDRKLIASVKWLCPEMAEKILHPCHLTFCLDGDTNVETFLDLTKEAFSDGNARFGLVGLHACGNLTIDVMRLFLQANCPSKGLAIFLNIFGCCYHKLSASGCPMSAHWKEMSEYRLSFNAREIACHAQETFSQRLLSNDYFYLKIHAFRAAAERILAAANMPLKRRVQNVNYHDELSFLEYVRLAGITQSDTIGNVDTQHQQSREDLKRWRQIVIFYSLRIFLAPLIEHTIQIDRIVYLLENGCSSAKMVAVFDPKLSPRNQMLLAFR